MELLVLLILEQLLVQYIGALVLNRDGLAGLLDVYGVESLDALSNQEYLVLQVYLAAELSVILDLDQPVADLLQELLDLEHRVLQVLIHGPFLLVKVVQDIDQEIQQAVLCQVAVLAR